MTQQDDLFGGTDSPCAPPALSSQVLPLGKYKGKPYDVLLTDSAYALWMLSSMYAKLEKQHPALFAFLISRFGPPEHSPVHNELQNRFLDEDFCMRFAMACSPKLRSAAAHLSQLRFDIEALWQKNVRDSFAPILRLSNWDSNKAALARGTKRLEALRNALAEEWSLLKLYGADRDRPGTAGVCMPTRLYGLEFEDEGADVSFSLRLCYELYASRSEVPTGERRYSELLTKMEAQRKFRIEVKPVVGDDYPAVLRRMKAANNNALLVEEFNGAGATWAQLVKVFALSKINVVSLEEVERTVVPEGIQSFSFEPLTETRAHAILAQEFADHLAELQARVAQRPEPGPPRIG